jgi:hypothetical protein
VTVTVDGAEQQGTVIPLADDRREHNVEVGIPSLVSSQQVERPV